MTRKRVCILTFHNSRNYGAVLQAYALQKKMGEIFEIVEILDYRNEKIEYLANSIDSLENHEICENGGMIALRIYNENIGTYKSTKDKKVIYDGSLLKKANINEDDLKFTISMDLIIETNEGIKYKTNLQYELPTDKFENSGVKMKVINEFSDVIFKRE